MSALVQARVRAAWPPTLSAIAALLLAALWIYRDTAAGMEQLWARSETFAHGYFVPLISIWLIWRQRVALAAAEPSPSPSAILVALAAAALWFVGDLAGVNALTQFAFVALLGLAVPVCAGWHVARLILFPLAFLFFAVPFGEFLMPWLMARTADVTVLALRLSGIPVYRDGLQFVIPSGTWSVVEACSGVRYLIASLMVGALFAHMHYRSTRRRWLFMLIALAVPIAANWLRAYLIVMIGHLSDNKLAAGVDHLIYGWLFFGVVIGAMFWIGVRWSEAHAPQPASTTRVATRSGPSGGRRLGLATAAMVAVLALPTAMLEGLRAGEVAELPRLTEPDLAGARTLETSALPPWKPAFGNPSASLERQYDVLGEPVGVHLVYFRHQAPDRKLVSSVNALVPSADPLWKQSMAGSRLVALGQTSLVVRSALLQRPLGSSDQTRLRVWQFYWVDGRFEAHEALAKLRGAWQRLKGQGDDGAAVFIYTNDGPGAEPRLEGFLRQHLAAFDTALRKTRDGD